MTASASVKAAVAPIPTVLVETIAVPPPEPVEAPPPPLASGVSPADQDGELTDDEHRSDSSDSSEWKATFGEELAHSHGDAGQSTDAPAKGPTAPLGKIL